MMTNTLPKAERISQKKVIDLLFDRNRKENKSFAFFPVRVIYYHSDEVLVNQVLFSISKRYFKKATDRNKIKRWFREAYRQNKSNLNHLGYSMAFLYLSKEMPDYAQIEQIMKKILQRIDNKT